MLVEAATGGRSVFGRGIEKINLGVPQGPLEFVNFDSLEISRDDKENPSNAITGNDGRDRGTPGDIAFVDKVKYSMTPSRVLFDLVTAFGKPKSITPKYSIGTVEIDTPGTGYANPSTVTAAGGGGTGFTADLVLDIGTGAILGVTITSPGHGYTSAPVLTIHDGGVSGSAGVLIAHLTEVPTSWLVKIRPARTNELRAASLYLFEGGSYTATLQAGRRASMIQLTDAANKRTECDITYSDPTGDTISGFSRQPNSGNTGTYSGKLSSRGRRPYDANFTANKSMYVKIVDFTPGDDHITFKAKYDAPSADSVTPGDFPAGAYDVTTFEVPLSGDNDGYGTVVKDEGVVGLFGENYEAFELTFGDLSGIADITIGGSGGSLYSEGTTFGEAGDGGGSGFHARAVVDDGTVLSVSIGGGGGADYSADTTLTGTGGGGSGFSAHVTVDGGGTVLTVVVDNPGSGYTGAPTVVVDDPGGIGSGATFTAVVSQIGAVTGVVIDNPGTGYTSAPTITVTDPSGAGSGATFTAVLSSPQDDDEFEIPAACEALEKTTNIETRLSAFHLIRKLGGSKDVRFDKGTCKIERPFKAYRANGKRIPQFIDATGTVMGAWNFSKRLFDRYFRQRSDEHARFSVYDRYKVENGDEAVEVYAGQCAVMTMKSGGIATRDTLEETITFESEQPESAGSPPTGFDGTYPIEVNVTTKVDPSWLD